MRSRYKPKGKDWSDSTGFAIIHDQANLWIKASTEQEQKALAHCGNCFSVLKPAKNQTPGTACPKDCKCSCADGKPCHVHFTCGCLNKYELCNFHKSKRPELIVRLYHHWPSGSQIRYGKGRRYRELPLNSAVCEALQAWLIERKEKFAGRSVAPSLFLNPQGKQMLPNSIYEVIRKIGRDAGLELSPHTLRHTCLTTLIRNHNDVILVADIAGHKSLNTTRRYTLPTQADKAKALEELLD